MVYVWRNCWRHVNLINHAHSRPDDREYVYISRLSGRPVGPTIGQCKPPITGKLNRFNAIATTVKTYLKPLFHITLRSCILTEAMAEFRGHGKSWRAADISRGTTVTVYMVLYSCLSFFLHLLGVGSSALFQRSLLTRLWRYSHCIAQVTIYVRYSTTAT